MKRLCLAAAFIMVAACNSEPPVRADSERNFNASMRRLEKVVAPERLAELDRALQDIILTREVLRDYEGTYSFGAIPALATHAGRLRSPLSAWPAARSSMVVDQIGTMVDNLSVQEIIDVAQRQRSRMLAHLSDFTLRTSSMSEMLSHELPPPPPVALTEQEISDLGRIGVAGEMALSFNQSSGLRRFVSFTVTNGLEMPIRSVLLSDRRSDPEKLDRDTGKFEYTFPTALPPNATRRIIVSSPVEAGTRQQSGRLKLFVVGAVFGNDQRIGLRDLPTIDHQALERRFTQAILFGAPGAVHRFKLLGPAETVAPL